MIAHAVYAYSLLRFLCEVEYASIESEVIVETRDVLSEEFETLSEVLLKNFPKDDASTLECQNYVKKYFGVGLDIYNLTPTVPVTLRVVGDAFPMIEPYFLTKEDVMMIIGYAVTAQHLFMESDGFEVSDSKEVEVQSLEAVSAILAILLKNLSMYPPFISACKEYVMKEYEIAIPFHLS